jgi:hypothetical protein
MSYGAILIMPSLLSAGRTWALAEASEGKKTHVYYHFHVELKQVEYSTQGQEEKSPLIWKQMGHGRRREACPDLTE